MSESHSKLIPFPTPTETDLVRLAHYDSSVRKRGLIEMALVRKMVSDIIVSNNAITVNDGEDYPVKVSTDVEAIMDAVFAVEECWLSVHLNGDKDKVLGVIFLVFGNDGWDAINDYHTSLEDLLKSTNDYAEALSEWC